MVKVFLVEDESLIREGLRDKIPWEEWGFQFVGDAPDGEIALPLIRKTSPDILITDIKMPFMDGITLSKAVLTDFPKTKIIIISGYDDFEYARQAISLGVQQYLLKPITKMTLKKVLAEVREKVLQDQEQKGYQEQFENEMQEYQQFSYRRFIETVTQQGMKSVQIQEAAEKYGITLSGPSFNMVFFYLQEKPGQNVDDQEELLHLVNPQKKHIFFRWNMNVYGLLMQGQAEQLYHQSREVVETIVSFEKSREYQVEWYVAAGNPVNSPEKLAECYRTVYRYFSYRFLLPEMHILTRESLADNLIEQKDYTLDQVDSSKMDPEIIKEFLQRGYQAEIEDFVETYLFGIREALKSRIFRDYVILSIRFTVVAYIESLKVEKEEYMGRLEKRFQDMHMNPSDIKDYFEEILQVALEMRDRESSYQSTKVLRKALEYIDANFTQDTLSLNTVANEVFVNANYLSAVFSQNVQKTFVEYVTSKRMELAKNLLRSTDKNSGEIAENVGYKDPHYFSFVFKKTQGMSPREYRKLQKIQ